VLAGRAGRLAVTALVCSGSAACNADSSSSSSSKQAMRAVGQTAAAVDAAGYNRRRIINSTTTLHKTKATCLREGRQRRKNELPACDALRLLLAARDKTATAIC